MPEFASGFHAGAAGRIDYSSVSCSCALGQPGRSASEPDIYCKPEAPPTPPPRLFIADAKRVGGDYPTLNGCITACYEVDLTYFDSVCVKR